MFPPPAGTCRRCMLCVKYCCCPERLARACGDDTEFESWEAILSDPA